MYGTLRSRIKLIPFVYSAFCRKTVCKSRVIPKIVARLIRDVVVKPPENRQLLDLTF